MGMGGGMNLPMMNGAAGSQSGMMYERGSSPGLMRGSSMMGDGSMVADNPMMMRARSPRGYNSFGSGGMGSAYSGSNYSNDGGGYSNGAGGYSNGRGGFMTSSRGMNRGLLSSGSTDYLGSSGYTGSDNSMLRSSSYPSSSYYNTAAYDTDPQVDGYYDDGYDHRGSGGMRPTRGGDILKAVGRKVGRKLKRTARKIKDKAGQAMDTAVDLILDFAELSSIDQYRAFGTRNHECTQLTPEQVASAPSSFFRVMSRNCFKDLSPDVVSAIPGMYLGRIRWWRDATPEQVSAIFPENIIHLPFKRLGKMPYQITRSPVVDESAMDLEGSGLHPCLGVSEEHEEVLAKDRKVWQNYCKRCRGRKPSWTRFIPIAIFVLLIVFLLVVVFYAFAEQPVVAVASAPTVAATVS